MRLLSNWRALALLLLAVLSSLGGLLISILLRPQPSSPLLSVKVDGEELVPIREGGLHCWRWTSGPIFVDPPLKVAPAAVVTSFTIGCTTQETLCPGVTVTVVEKVENNQPNCANQFSFNCRTAPTYTDCCTINRYTSLAACAAKTPTCSDGVKISDCQSP